MITQTPARIIPLPGTLCWTKERPFQAPALMLVLAAENKTTAVVEVPIASSVDGAEQGLEAALAQIQARSVTEISPRLLGPAIGRLTQGQYERVRDSLRGDLTLAA